MAHPVALEPVKTTPATRGSLTRAAPTAPGPGKRCSTPPGTPASCSSLTARKATIGVCSGGLGQHRIAGRQRGGDLARENGEREVPGRDAGERAAAPQLRACWSRRSGPGARSARRTGAAPRPRSSAGSRPPRARRPARCRASCRPRAPSPPSAARGRARRGRRPCPGSPPAPARPAGPSLAEACALASAASIAAAVGGGHGADAHLAVVRAQHQFARLGAGQRLAIDDRHRVEEGAVELDPHRLQQGRAHRRLASARARHCCGAAGR